MTNGKFIDWLLNLTRIFWKF